MSLRARLVLGLVAIAAVGLALVAVVTYVALRSFLLDRVDQQLTLVREPLGTTLSGVQVEGLQTGPLVEEAAAQIAVPPGSYGELRRADGRVVAASRATVEGENDVPDLPDPLPGAGTRPGSTIFEAPGADPDAGPDEFRVMAQRLPNGATLIVALPLDSVHETLDRLVVVEGVVVAVVLIAVALAGWVVVGSNLRPLRQIADSAADISAGELDRRVPASGGPAEVVRVGSAMNTMLDRIERSFDDQQASDRRLRQFVADASHELKTPLTTIRGYAELFRRGADRRPEDLALSMRRIEEEASRMGALVEDLLLLASLDERPRLTVAGVDLAALCADAVADAEPLRRDRRVTTELDVGVVVAGDADRLRQVVGNLLTNALVHTPPGTPVRVRVHRSVDEGLLEVADEGPGMDEETARHVFDRFDRGRAGRSDAPHRADREPGPRVAEAGSGAGLGLSIVTALVDAHDGQVELISAPGAGARFVVHLPLWADPDPPPTT